MKDALATRSDDDARRATRLETGLLWAGLATLAALFAVWMRPLVRPPSAYEPTQTAVTEGAIRLRDNAARLRLPPGNTFTAATVYAVTMSHSTPLVRVAAVVAATQDFTSVGDAPPRAVAAPQLRVAQVVTSARWEAVVLFIGAAVGGLIGLLFFIDQRRIQNRRMLPELEEPVTPATTHSAETYLRGELRFIMQELAGASSRARTMLVGGILMAFVGLGVFAASAWSSPQDILLPQTVPDDSGATVSCTATDSPVPTTGPSPYAALIHASRPFALLVFLESVAYFLLRRYRAAIADYGAFCSVYVRRSGYLTALKLLDATPEGRQVVATALLGDAPNFLVPAEPVTESTPNPIWDLVKTTLGRKPPAPE